MPYGRGGFCIYRPFHFASESLLEGVVFYKLIQFILVPPCEEIWSPVLPNTCFPTFATAVRVFGMDLSNSQLNIYIIINAQITMLSFLLFLRYCNSRILPFRSPLSNGVFEVD